MIEARMAIEVDERFGEIIKDGTIHRFVNNRSENCVIRCG